MANISKIKTPDGTSYDIKAIILSMNGYGEVGTDNTPYLYRRSGGNATNVGNRELDEIVGGSIVWNQIFSVRKCESDNTDNRDYLNLVLRESTSPYSALLNQSIYQTGWVNRIVNSTITSEGGLTLLHSGGQRNIFFHSDVNMNVITGHKYLFKLNVTSLDFTTIGGVVLDDINLIDLTALFGTTIADYIYSLEQSTAGSGIAWLKSYGYLTEDYYGYTANKIESVSVARHVMKDSNDSVIGSYAINPITLRGIPKLNASNQLYYDGDRYEASGRVTRKYGIVDLGTLTWSINPSQTRFIADFPQAKKFPNLYSSEGDSPINILCEKYKTISGNRGYDATDNLSISGSFWNGLNNLQVNDFTYTDAAAFKAAMSGVYLIYELATPTTESTSPFEANQIVDANGTEEYIDAGVEAGARDVAIPVGHETKYLEIVSSRDIELPPQPSTDGKYNLNLDVTNSTPSFEFETASQALTYTLGTSGNNLTLTPSSGSTQSITAPYATNAGKVNNHTVNKDVPSDAVFTDNNTTYTFAEGTTNGAFSVTPSGGTVQSVPVHGVLTSHQSVTDNNPTLSWGSKSKVATIGSTEINVTMPSNPASGKQDTITGGATTITSSNLTTNRALVSNGSGKVAVSDVTSTELGYLDGVTSNVQTQLDNRLPLTGGTLSSTLTISSGGLTTSSIRSSGNVNRTMTSITVGTTNNNGVTDSSTYGGFQIVDSNAAYFARVRGTGYNDGKTATILETKNTKTDGTDVTNIFGVGVNKNGTRYYTCSDTSKFRSDFGIQATITGAATTVVSDNLTASRVLISNTAGKISAASGVTTTEVGYLAGLDRNVMGFYSHKSYDYDISNDNMRGTSGQYEKNGSYWIKVEDWLGTMPPSGSYGTLEVMGNLQRFTVYSSNGSSTVYTRTYANSTWSDWKRIGSGVDASVSGTTLTLSSV